MVWNAVLGIECASLVLQEPLQVIHQRLLHTYGDKKQNSYYQLGMSNGSKTANCWDLAKTLSSRTMLSRLRAIRLEIRDQKWYLVSNLHRDTRFLVVRMIMFPLKKNQQQWIAILYCKWPKLIYLTSSCDTGMSSRAWTLILTVTELRHLRFLLGFVVCSLKKNHTWQYCVEFSTDLDTWKHILSST